MPEHIAWYKFKITNASSEKQNIINEEILDINDLTEVERILESKL